MDTLINLVLQYATLTNLALCALGYLYYITTAGYYMGVIVPSGALDDFPYPRVARFLCLFWPLFMVASMIGAYFEGDKNV